MGLTYKKPSSPETAALILGKMEENVNKQPVQLENEPEDVKPEADPIMIKVQVNHDLECCPGISEGGPDPNDGEECHDWYHYPDPSNTCPAMTFEVELHELESGGFIGKIPELCDEHKDAYHTYESLETLCSLVQVVWDDASCPAQTLSTEEDWEIMFNLLPVRGYSAKLVVDWNF